ncbi:branched-chain amino acid ABC transporter permease/ATP-binding protein [Gordonia hydrophobica]|uniref:Branched-chain amino acid ABC transporter permease/ATP-binding protein n=1 Tax=Gordonia hydrophobica TaxID=40516 RepID=A0ABZ2U1P3_9ACTN|nr:branched-chain amino acid ABC transporter permease/ATP-binding protein [Gordonia hydrophobica]MBM7368854.1 ABC-type branched-subunit amino acid transport system ATPase component/branched-subunit amino acid ABC-type transport system permease component [Gordonia hydrophobica]
MQHLVFLLLGLGNGAVFGALALAIVLTYRSSGVVNFATGAIALYTAYTYAYLREGELLILIPGLPDSIDLGGPMGMWPAILISLVIAAVLGLILYLLIFRPLRTSPLVARAVAALGVSLLVAGLVAEKLGTDPVSVDPIFPTDIWQSGDLQLSADRFYFALTIVLLAIALAVVFRFTKFGLATRASAESERGAYVSGISPDRIAAYNWMLSSAVAGLAGILIAPIVPLVPVAYTLFIIPALAAAILARFDMVIVAVFAGVAIGMLQSEAQNLAATYDWLPSSGLPELVPLILILVVLLIRAKPLPSRGETILQTLGRAPRPHHVAPTAVVMTIVGVLALVFLDDRMRSGLIISLIMAIIALSSVVVTGFAGQVSLAQLTIAGVAAFLLGPIANNLHLPFPIAPIVAALCAAVIGVLIGLPALRIRGLTVAVVTLTMAYVLEAVWFRNIDVVGGEGIKAPKPSLFGWDLSIGQGLDYPRVTFGILVLLVLVAVAVFVAYLRRSGLGTEMLAVRANERSAAAAGVSVVRVKIFAFGIGAFIAGLGGSLLAYQQQTVTFDYYAAMAGVALFATVYLAGITSVSGGVLAGLLAANGLVFIFVDEMWSASGWYVVVSSVLLIFTVILNPEGIVGPAHTVLSARRAAALKAKSDSAPDLDVSREAPAEKVSRGPKVFDSSAQPELTLTDVSVRYGGAVALKDVSLQIPKGALVGLIGPNGAGKTTLMDAITGFVDYTGDVALSGTSMGGLAPYSRVRAGLGRTFQAIELYDDLSVTENVKVGRTAAVRRPKSKAEHSDLGHLSQVFDLLDIADIAERPAGELSQGQRQLVSIARALAGSPNLLLLDEPAGGLDSTESRWLGERLLKVRDSGTTIVMVDHDMDLVLSVCDRVHVLNFGELIASGTPAEIRSNRTVATAYLGREAQTNG